jgi:hypothetical protein
VIGGLHPSGMHDGMADRQSLLGPGSSMNCASARDQNSNYEELSMVLGTASSGHAAAGGNRLPRLVLRCAKGGLGQVSRTLATSVIEI